MPPGYKDYRKKKNPETARDSWYITKIHKNFYINTKKIKNQQQLFIKERKVKRYLQNLYQEYSGKLDRLYFN